MFNLIQRPIERTTLEAWAKMSDDIAKVAILAVPVMLLDSSVISLKVINGISLIFSAYAFLCGGRFIRKHLTNMEGK
ncbi:hypothetical protein ACWA5Z_12100 [Testudinibacter sp. P80/BLE/0925]|uniref:hypothetical protein n=1 Tax=Testudinibacter sp. TW-1 TaxID=3417757 RepID=UPI003D35F824